MNENIVDGPSSDGVVTEGATTPVSKLLDVDAAILLGVARQVRRVVIADAELRANAQRSLAEKAGGAVEYRQQLFNGQLTDRDLLADIPRVIDGVPGYALRGDGKVVLWNPLKVTQPYSLAPAVEAIAGVNLNLATVRVGSSAMPVHAGVMAVSGPSDVGKSPLARAMAVAVCKALKLDSYASIPFGEPYPGYASDEALLPASLLYAMAKSPVVVLDSVKDLVLDSGGAAGKGGLSRVAQKFLSKLGPAAAQLGCVVIIPVNPSSTSKDAITEFYSGVMSTCSGFLQHDGGARWAWITRPVEAQERLSGSFTREKARSYDKGADESELESDLVKLVPDERTNGQHNRTFNLLQRLARQAKQF